MKIRLAIPDLQLDSIVDGEGIRCVLWTQGCIHNCLGCHNPQTHSFSEGYLVDIKKIEKEILDASSYHDGITFSGGDPMCQAEVCLEIAKFCKKNNINVWCYTGYTYEELISRGISNSKIKEFLENIDVLIDGKFILEKKSLDVKFRGSTNQRIIDVKKSLKEEKVVLFDKYNEQKEKEFVTKPKYMFV